MKIERLGKITVSFVYDPFIAPELIGNVNESV
jgi:hypothetical protein